MKKIEKEVWGLFDCPNIKHTPENWILKKIKENVGFVVMILVQKDQDLTKMVGNGVLEQ